MAEGRESSSEATATRRSISRRTFLIATTAGVGAAIGGGALLVGTRPRLVATWHELLVSMLPMTDDAMREIASIAAADQDATVDALLEALPACRGVRWTPEGAASTIPAQRALANVHEVVAREYAEGKVGHVHRWVLSETEIGFLALLHAAGSAS